MARTTTKTTARAIASDVLLAKLEAMKAGTERREAALDEMDINGFFLVMRERDLLDEVMDLIREL